VRISLELPIRERTAGSKIDWHARLRARSRRLLVRAEERLADFTVLRCLVDELVEAVEGGLLVTVYEGGGNTNKVIYKSEEQVYKKVLQTTFR